MQAQYEVADVLEAHWPEIERSAHINGWQIRTLGAIKRCRTAAMGGHLDACTDCGNIRISYNSCRNRHCPKCQGKKREEWIAKRETELLPVPYFHVVFTLPDVLNPLAMHQPKSVYDSLFEAAWQTIEAFGKDEKHLGARAGMICILHTWGQTLTLHPHLHCIVPGGGLGQRGNWKTAHNCYPLRGKGGFLFPVKAMSKVFKSKYLAALRSRIPDVDRNMLNILFKKDWVVYAKRPFGGPEQVLEYLGRYTHKIAISNHRLQEVNDKTVTFGYKDYRNGAQKQSMTLDGMEFIRRFALHILPKGFVRIRHYGILSSSAKIRTIPCIKAQLPLLPINPMPPPKAEPYNPLICPCCKTATMKTMENLPRRGSPSRIKTIKAEGFSID